MCKFQLTILENVVFQRTNLHIQTNRLTDRDRQTAHSATLVDGSHHIPQLLLVEEYASDRCITGSTPHHIPPFEFIQKRPKQSCFETQFVKNIC